MRLGEGEAPAPLPFNLERTRAPRAGRATTPRVTR
jgi:hypothetical protein